jgi:RNA recognition motif-containing protein
MTKLFVGNLSFDVTQEDLRAAFAPYGPVSSANVVVDRSDGGSRGFGFIEMPRQAQAMAAIQGLNGTDLKGRRLNVSQARSQSERGRPENASRGWAVVGDGRNHW